jgi:xylulokinase
MGIGDDIIAVDLGTTHARVAIFSGEGECRTLVSRGLPLSTDAGGRAEQDAEAVWQALRELLAEAVTRAGARRPLALSASVQGDAVIPVDRGGHALHPALLGMDYRSREQAALLERSPGGRRLFRITGMRPHPLTSLCKILWLRENKPEIASKTWRFETYSDYLLAKLGADPAIDRTMASRTMVYDLRRDDWSAWVADRVGLDLSRLSPVVDSGAAVGRLDHDIAAEAGMEHPPLLVAGAHDQVCAALGCGVPVHGRCVVSTGSAEVLSVAFPKPLLTESMYRASYPCYRYACPGLYFTFSLNHAAGVLLEWFRETLAAEPGPEAVARLFGALGEGPSPLLVLPHWNGAGTPRCDPDSRGAILGLTLSTTRRDIALGILEGLCYELALNLEAMELAGLSIPELTATGGGSGSPEWVQLKADVLGRPIRLCPTREAAALGAAVLAAHGGGLYPTIESAVAAMARRGVVIEPRPARTAAHGERLELYRSIYPSIAPITRRLTA